MKESVRKKLVWWVIGFNFTLGIVMAYNFHDYMTGFKRMDPDLAKEYFRLQHQNKLIDQGYSPDIAATATNSFWDSDPITRMKNGFFNNDNEKATLAMIIDPTGRTSINSEEVNNLYTIGRALDRTNWAFWDYGSTEGAFTRGKNWQNDASRNNVHKYLLDRYNRDEEFRRNIQLAEKGNDQDLGQQLSLMLNSAETAQDYADWQKHTGRYAPPQSINPNDANAIGQSVLAAQEVKPSTGNPFDDLRTEVQDKAQKDVMARRDEMRKNAYTNLQAQLQGLDPDKQLEMINITERNLNAELAKIKGTPEWEAATRERQKQLERDRAIVKGIAYRNRVQRTAAEADRKSAEYLKSIAPTPLHRGAANKPVVIRKPGEKWSFMGY